MASSLALPPAFLMTCASPSVIPAKPAGSSLASMHVSMAVFLAGGMARSPLFPNFSEYLVLERNSSSRIELMIESIKNVIRMYLLKKVLSDQDLSLALI